MMKTINKVNSVLVLFVLLFCNLLSYGQSMNLGAAINASPSTAIDIPLNVAGFTNIGAMDIKVTFDNTIMTFSGTANASADAAGILSNVTLVSGNTSQVNLSWLATGSAGVNFTNGKFLDLRFNYINGNTAVNFNLLACEVTDWDGNPVSVSYSNTTVSQQFVISNFNVSGSGSYCSTSTGLAVGLDGSQTGVNYQLKKGGVNDGSTIPGTGSALSWINKTAGTYTVEARYGATFQSMNGNAVISTISPSPVSVTINASSTNIAFGTNVDFTATPVNGGVNPSYQWKVNNVNAGSNSNTYSFVPTNQDVIKCVMTSDLSCVSNNPATSNNITINVTQASAMNLGNAIVSATNTDVFVPINVSDMNNMGSMDIKVTYDNTVMTFVELANLSTEAAGTISNITTAGTIGTVNISWLNNGSMGVNFVNGKFLDLKFNYIGGSSAINFNQALCELADWNGNLINAGYTNTTISQFVINTFNVSGSGSYCSGSTGVTVTLDGSQSGVNYQIKKGGVNDGSTIPGTGSALSWTNKTAGTYTIEARYGSSLQLMNGNAVVTATTPQAVAVSISANSTNVLQGTTVNFTANPTNGGSTPAYQWKVNNVNAGTNSNTFSFVPSNADVVKCVMISGLTACLSNNPATSTGITITVTSPTASVNLGSSIAAVPGTEVLVPVNLSNLINTGAIDLKIKYDSTKLSFVDLANLSVNATGSIANPTNLNGVFKQINLSWIADLSGINPNGKFLDLRFNYIGGNTSLEFNQLLCEITTWDGIPVGANYSNVSIKPTAIWTGILNNSWEVAANWTNNYLPNSGSDVIIPVVTTNYPTINVPVAINNLTLESNSNGTASLLDNSNLTVNGVSNIKCYVDGNKWHLISIPVQSATSGVFHLAAGQADVYIREYNAGWNYITNTSTPLISKKGYAIWADTQTNSTPNPTFSFTGSLNTGNQIISTVPSWNLVGNPYTSALDWNTINPSNIEGSAVKVWNQALGVYSTYSSIGGSVNGGNQYLSSMQGFFVKALDANGINLSNTNRVHSNQPLQKSSNTINNLVKIKAQRGAYSDEINVVYNTIATNNYDPSYDASKLFVNDVNIPEIYSLASNKELAINVFGTLPAAIPVNIRMGIADNASLTASDFDNFDSNVSIKLEDIFTGSIQDLRQNPVYTFAGSANDNANRFVLHFANSTGINEPNITSVVTIYSNENTIYINTNDKVINISIFDVLGKLIVSESGNPQGLTSIKMESATAYYMVKVTTDKGVSTEKVFVK